MATLCRSYGAIKVNKIKLELFFEYIALALICFFMYYSLLMNLYENYFLKEDI